MQRRVHKGADDTSPGYITIYRKCDDVNPSTRTNTGYCVTASSQGERKRCSFLLLHADEKQAKKMVVVVWVYCQGRIYLMTAAAAVSMQHFDRGRRKTNHPMLPYFATGNKHPSLLPLPDCILSCNNTLIIYAIFSSS
jgi:hypothetical protein